MRFERSPKRNTDKTLLDTLPYLFHDPVRVDLKVDPRTASFGSKVDGSETRQEKLFTVDEVVAPNEVLLSSGEHVRLLGVKPIKRHARKAIEYLRNIVGGKRVYLRMDASEPATEETPSAYVYLRNRTPVNRHLIRSGLVAVDTTRDYRFKKAFLEEQAGKG